MEERGRRVKKGKHIKMSLQRGMAVILTAIVLTFTVAGDCIVQPAPVYATGLAYEALLALIEVVMASMGLSFSSQADLNSAAGALRYGMENDYQYAVQGTDLFAGLKEGLQNVSAGSVIVPTTVYVALQSWLYNYASGNISEGVDVGNPELSGSIVFPAGLQMVSGFHSNADLLFGDTSFKENSGTRDYEVDFNRLNESEFVLVGKFGDMSERLFVMEKGIKITGGYLVFDSDKQFFKLYGRDGKSIGTCYFNRVDIRYWSSSNYYDTYRDGGLFGGLSGNSVNFCAFDSSWIASKLYLKSGVPVYSSPEQGAMMVQLSLISGLNSKVYGLASSAGSKSITKNDDGTVTFSDLQPGITKAVEMSVANALAANPAITDAELNAVAAQVIASNEQIKDEISSEITEQTGVLAGLLTSIKAVADGNSIGLAGLKTSVDALQESVDALAMTGEGVLDWPDELLGVGEAFGEVSGTVDAGDSDSDNDDTGPPLVWVPDMYKVPAFLRGLLEYFTVPLRIITQSLQRLWALINGLVQDLSDTFQTWVEPLVRGLGIPGVIDVNPGAAFREWLEGLFGDIAIPGIMDVPGVGEIEGILTNALVIDTAAIADAAEGLGDVWSDVFPVDEITNVFKGFDFPDTYSYPVIQMPTPEILKQFYDNDYIVFLDFGEDLFREYCLWIRGLMRAFVWFGFILYLQKMFSVKFHVA